MVKMVFCEVVKRLKHFCADFFFLGSYIFGFVLFEAAR